MAKKDPHIKHKIVEVSGRSFFGRPSQMDKTIAAYSERGWQVQHKRKVRGKERYTLTFVYRMSDEELAAERKSQRQRMVWVLAFVATVIIFSLISSSQQQATQAVTQTAQAQEQGTQIAQANATDTQQSLVDTVTATWWTPTPTPSQTLTPTITDTPTITPTPSITPKVNTTPLPTPVPVTSAPPQIYYVNQPANARACSRRDCKIVTTLAIGTAVSSIGRERGDAINDNNVWYRVVYNGELLFIHSSLLSETPPQPTSAPVTGGNQQLMSTVPPAPISQPVMSWDCNGDKYSCTYFDGKCAELKSYWNACPGDPSKLDQGGTSSIPCEAQCGSKW